MATRRNPLIPPPPLSGSGGVSRGAERGQGRPHDPVGGDDTRREETSHVGPSTSHDKQRPLAYRGKSSGEFQRVGASHNDVGQLVTEAEHWIAQLTDEDNYRRLLKLAVLRRDAALLLGLLEVVRHRSR